MAVFTQPLDYAEHSIIEGLGKNSLIAHFNKNAVGIIAMHFLLVKQLPIKKSAWQINKPDFTSSFDSTPATAAIFPRRAWPRCNQPSHRLRPQPYRAFPVASADQEDSRYKAQ